MDKARCDRTGNTIFLKDGFFTANPLTGEWQFVSKDAPENSADYNIHVGDLVKSAESLVDWLAHVNEKTWFKSDLFFKFFTRFRKDNALYS